MSRIGKLPIPIPSGVTVTKSADGIAVKGPKGELKLPAKEGVAIETDGKTLRVAQTGDQRDRKVRALFGTTRALLATMITGVTKGYERKLEINGVGYEAEVKGKEVVLKLGYAHPVTVPIPAGVLVETPTKTVIMVRGADKQMVGEFAARVRKLKKPEPYKGKGIKYDFEVIRRKQGKAFGST